MAATSSSRSRRAIFRLGGAGACAWLVAAVPVVATELPDTIERVRPSIVAIGTVQATRRPPGKFVATGFVVGDGVHVITSAHAMLRGNKVAEH